MFRPLDAFDDGRSEKVSSSARPPRGTPEGAEPSLGLDSRLLTLLTPPRVIPMAFCSQFLTRPDGLVSLTRLCGGVELTRDLSALSVHVYRLLYLHFGVI